MTRAYDTLFACAALTLRALSAAAATADRDAKPAVNQAQPGCLSLGAGPRVGGMLNEDQWLVGGHLRTNVPCLGGLGLNAVVGVGLGGNYMTIRPSLRLSYEWWIGGKGGLGIYPAVGGSLMYYVPVGPFAAWCNRYDVQACWGHVSGWEAGGGVEYRWLGLEVIGGFRDLPALTIAGTATFTLWDGSSDRSRP
jgi:hypothetical protein